MRLADAAGGRGAAHAPDARAVDGHEEAIADAGAAVSVFEEWRPLLFGAAYRMLGSTADAEDVVQDACVRWIRRRGEPVRSARAYLITIVTRLCLDRLDSLRVKRETYVGPWLPEPVVVDDDGLTEQADSISLAFLVLLEELTPLERAAYLLHDIFGYSFAEVARSLDRSPAACRQLGARARKRIESRRRRFDADLQHGKELTERFLAACANGELSGLVSMLAEDVVVWTDGGGNVRAALRPIIGPHRASRFLLNVAKRLHGEPRGAVLNGQPGCLFVEGDAVVGALVLDIVDGVVVGVRAVTNPDKLAHLRAAPWVLVGQGG